MFPRRRKEKIEPADLSIAALLPALFNRQRGFGQQIEIFRRLFSGQDHFPSAPQPARPVIRDPGLYGGRLSARRNEHDGVLGGLGIERDLHVGQGEWGSGAAAGEPAGDGNILIWASRPSIWASTQIDEVAHVEKARN